MCASTVSVCWSTVYTWKRSYCMRPDTLPKAGTVARQHAQARHARERGHRLRRIQQRHEALAHVIGLLLAGADRGQRFAQRARRLRMQAAGPGRLVPGREQLQHRRQALAQATGFAHGQVAVAQLVALGHRHRRLLAGKLLFEALQQAVVDTHHRRGAAEEGLHHLLHREVVAVLVLQAQHRRQGLLVVEAEPLLAAPGQQVQAEAQARQLAPFALEAGALVLAQPGPAAPAHAVPARRTGACPSRSPSAGRAGRPGLP